MCSVPMKYKISTSPVVCGFAGLSDSVEAHGVCPEVFKYLLTVLLIADFGSYYCAPYS